MKAPVMGSPVKGRNKYTGRSLMNKKMIEELKYLSYRGEAERAGTVWPGEVCGGSYQCV